MAGRHPFSELRAKMSPPAQERAAAKAKALDHEMDLAEVRHALLLSQEEVARNLGIGQAAVPKIERRADMYLSTLERVIRAMGGQLRIIAEFSGRDICIKHLSSDSLHVDAGADSHKHKPARKNIVHLPTTNVARHA